MSRKRDKLEARIKQLEDDLRMALQKKNTSQSEINLPARQRQIAALKVELSNTK